MSVPTTECVSSAHEEFFCSSRPSSSTSASASAAISIAALAAEGNNQSLTTHSGVPHEKLGNVTGTGTTVRTTTAQMITVETHEAPKQQQPRLPASPGRIAPTPPSTLALKAPALCTPLPTNGSSSNGANNGNATNGNNANAAVPLPSSALAPAASSSSGFEPATPTVETSAATPVIDLLRWKDMPRHLQFNRYIVEGYRPLTDAKGCIHSLFYFHNETVNILTHGIPVLYILATVPYLLPWDDFRWLSWCHLLGTLAPWCGSFVYHLFMNLDQGEVVYYRLLKLDMFGIWVSQSFGAITFVTATAFCWKLRTLVIGGYCILCLWGLYKALLAASPWQRRLCFLFPFVMRLHLVVLRMMKMAGGNTESMVHVYLQDAVSIVGGAIGAMNIPEKWLPGNVDFFLNSHNIMHVLVVVAVYSMHQASMRDMEWMSKSGCGAAAANVSEALGDALGALQHSEL